MLRRYIRNSRGGSPFSCRPTQKRRIEIRRPHPSSRAITLPDRRTRIGATSPITSNIVRAVHNSALAISCFGRAEQQTNHRRYQPDCGAEQHPTPDRRPLKHRHLREAGKNHQAGIVRRNPRRNTMAASSQQPATRIKSCAAGRSSPQPRRAWRLRLSGARRQVSPATAASRSAHSWLA